MLEYIKEIWYDQGKNVNMESSPRFSDSTAYNHKALYKKGPGGARPIQDEVITLGEVRERFRRCYIIGFEVRGKSLQDGA